MKYILPFTTLLSTVSAVAYCPVPPTTTTYVASKPVTASSSSVAPSGTPDSGYFGVISARSASPIHLLTLTARGGKFYLGGDPPSSYCPESVGDACPPGNTTVLSGGQNTLGLGVVVPGGQQVYVAPDGTLSYTIAHSGATPAGSVATGFGRVAPVGDAQFGSLTWTDGFSACPGNATEGWQVYGGAGSSATDCLGFDALAVATEEAGAWQY